MLKINKLWNLIFYISNLANDFKIDKFQYTYSIQLKFILKIYEKILLQQNYTLIIKLIFEIKKK